MLLKLFKNKTIKYITKGIFLFIFIFISASTSADNVYINKKCNFSFVIPESWVEMSYSSIETRQKELEKNLGKKMKSTLDAGFKKEHHLDFESPYIVINIYPHYGALTEKKFMEKYLVSKEINSNSFAGKAITMEIIKNLKIGDSDYDQKRKIAYIKGAATRAGVGDIVTISAIILGKNDIININFTSLSKDFQDEVESFADLMKSFSFRSGYAFDE